MVNSKNASENSLAAAISSNSRLIVHEGIKDQLIERVLYRLGDWRTGTPLDPANRLGAIVSKKQYDQILNYIRIGKEEGATVIAGGNPIEIDGSMHNVRVMRNMLINHPSHALCNQPAMGGPVYWIRNIAYN